MPVGWILRARLIPGNLVELSPSWCDLAEPTLAVIPAFVIRRTEAITHTLHEPQKANFVFRELLELEWIHVEAKKDVVALHGDVRIGRIWFGIPTEIKLQKLRLHGRTS